MIAIRFTDIKATNFSDNRCHKSSTKALRYKCNVVFKIVSTCHFYQKTKIEDKKKHEKHKKRLIYEKQIYFSY